MKYKYNILPRYSDYDNLSYNLFSSKHINFLLGKYACAKGSAPRLFNVNTLGKKNPFDVSQTDPEVKDVTKTIVTSKGVENVGESKLAVKLQPKRLTTLMLEFKASGVQSVDFKVDGETAHVS